MLPLHSNINTKTLTACYVREKRQDFQLQAIYAHSGNGCNCGATHKWKLFERASKKSRRKKTWGDSMLESGNCRARARSTWACPHVSESHPTCCSTALPAWDVREPSAGLLEWLERKTRKTPNLVTIHWSLWPTPGFGSHRGRAAQEQQWPE